MKERTILVLYVLIGVLGILAGAWPDRRRDDSEPMDPRTVRRIRKRSETCPARDRLPHAFQKDTCAHCGAKLPE